MQQLLELYADKSGDQLSQDELYNLGLNLKEIGAFFNSVSLLTIADEYVSKHPVELNYGDSHL
jgi:uncharacterized protein YdgA (DUF945 family)